MSHFLGQLYFFLSVQYIEIQVDRLLIFKHPSNFKFAVSFGRNAMGFLSRWPNRSKVSYGHIATQPRPAKG